MKPYDTAVIGAGPAGMMAAIRAAQLKKNVILLERNAAIGKKLLLTGNGRCNITNNAPIEGFMKSFGQQGRFLKPAFFAFTPGDLIGFFTRKGLKFKIEGEGRVFPVTNRASSVVAVLREYLTKHKVRVLYGARVISLERKDSMFQLQWDRGGVNPVHAKKVIIATGGASYKKTGSSGDGFVIAQTLGHAIVDLRPALVPLIIKEPWIKKLQGLPLKDVRIDIRCGGKHNMSPRGELIFTHFGISGPLVLDISAAVVSGLAEGNEVMLFIDFTPEISHDQLKAEVLFAGSRRGSSQLRSFLGNFLPQRLIAVFLQRLDTDGKRRVEQLTRKERLLIEDSLKHFPLRVAGSLPLERAMVTNGGIATAEINAKTLESRLVPGLYFAGEIIEGCGKSGGFNLQQAFSTGYLAGEKASA